MRKMKNSVTDHVCPRNSKQSDREQKKNHHKGKKDRQTGRESECEQITRSQKKLERDLGRTTNAASQTCGTAPGTAGCTWYSETPALVAKGGQGKCHGVTENVMAVSRPSAGTKFFFFFFVIERRPGLLSRIYLQVPGEQKHRSCLTNVFADSVKVEARLALQISLRRSRPENKHINK